MEIVAWIILCFCFLRAIYYSIFSKRRVELEKQKKSSANYKNISLLGNLTSLALGVLLIYISSKIELRLVWLSLGIFVAVFSLLLFLIKLYLFRNLDYEPRNYLSDEKEISIIKTLGMLCVNLTIFTLWIYSSIDFLNNM